MAKKPRKRRPAVIVRPGARRKPPTVRRSQHQDDTAKPVSRPKLLRATPRLTAAELLASVWKGDRERGDDIAVKQVKKIRSPTALPDYIAYRIATYNKDNKHVHRVTLLFKDKVSPNSKVIVDDDTYRHVFYFEYALAKRGNAFIYRSNGEPPSQTNPRHKPGISKHTYTAMRYILRAARAGKL